MRIELTYTGVAKNRRYFATLATAGRPRKTDAIVKSKKVFAEGATKDEAVTKLLELLDFKPPNVLTVGA